MFFSAKLFNWKFTPCSAIFCHSPSHAPRRALPTDSIQQLEKEAGQLTMQAVRIAIFIRQLFN
jgi:hypothetical protein